MAFTTLSYIFKSILTAAKMTALFDNTVALRDGSARVATGGGTANAQTATTSPAFTALNDGLEIVMTPTVSNAGSMTLNLDGIGNTACFKIQNGVVVSLVPGDVVINIYNRWLYSSQNIGWILKNPLTRIVPLSQLSAGTNQGYPQSGIGGEASLRTIRGTITGSGSITSGAGFTITKTGTGAYTINYTTQFNGPPSTVASVHLANGVFVSALPSGSSQTLISTFSTISVNAAFNFISIGPT